MSEKYRMKEVSVILKSGVSLVAEVDSIEGLKSLLNDLSTAKLEVQRVRQTPPPPPGGTPPPPGQDDEHPPVPPGSGPGLRRAVPQAVQRAEDLVRPAGRGSGVRYGCNIRGDSRSELGACTEPRATWAAPSATGEYRAPRLRISRAATRSGGGVAQTTAAGRACLRSRPCCLTPAAVRPTGGCSHSSRRRTSP